MYPIVLANGRGGSEPSHGQGSASRDGKRHHRIQNEKITQPFKNTTGYINKITEFIISNIRVAKDAKVGIGQICKGRNGACSAKKVG